MEVKDSKIITELKVVRDTLKDIGIDNVNFDTHKKIIICKTSLDVIINLIDCVVQ
ncbi:MAG: hypothetical protein ACRCX8_08250 [Sarcina sp.]